MNSPLVSIIIPVYNSEKYLAETINSVLNQSYKNIEIIIVDNGSADNSMKVAEGFKSANVKVFFQTKKGASAARNLGLNEAKGDYIQFLDADDLLSPDKIDAQMALIGNKNNTLSICRTVYFYDNNPITNPTENDEIEYFDDPVEFLLNMYYRTFLNKKQRGIVTVHSWLSPRHLLDKAGPWNEDLSVDDDGEYFCRVALQSETIVHVPGIFNYYRKYQSKSNLSAQNSYKAMQSSLFANQLKYAHLKEKSDNAQINIAFAKVFMENTVTFYPQYLDLYRIAQNKVNELGGISYVPVIGGNKIELIKKFFGWKPAKWLLHKANKISSIFNQNKQL